MSGEFRLRGTVEPLADVELDVSDRVMDAAGVVSRVPTRGIFGLRVDAARVSELLHVDASNARLVGLEEVTEWSGPWSEIASTPRGAPFVEVAPGPHVEVTLRAAKLRAGDAVEVRGVERREGTGFRGGGVRWIDAAEIRGPRQPKEAVVKAREARREKNQVRSFDAVSWRVAMVFFVVAGVFVGTVHPNAFTAPGLVAAGSFLLLAYAAWLEGERLELGGAMVPSFFVKSARRFEDRFSKDFGRTLAWVFLVVGCSLCFIPGKEALACAVGTAAITTWLFLSFARWERVDAKRLRILLGESGPVRVGAYGLIEGALESEGPGTDATWVGHKNAALAGWGEAIADGKYWIATEDGERVLVTEGAMFATTSVSRRQLNPRSYKLEFRSLAGARVRVAGVVTQGNGRLELAPRGPESLMVLCHREGELPWLRNRLLRFRSLTVCAGAAAMLVVAGIASFYV